jgi:hypothetical protein
VADVFEEVEEQLRSARYETIVKKGWPWLAGALVVGVLATLAVWAWNNHQAAESAKASEGYQAGLDALAKRDSKTAEARFAEIAASGPPAYKAMALMQQADLRVNENKLAEAVVLLDKAADTVKDPTLSDAARLKAIYASFDTASLAEIEKRVEPLAKTGRPYIALAREALAMKRLAAGKTAEARQAFSLLAISPDAAQGLQGRANVAMGVIDAGQAATIAPVAKAAAGLTPAQVEAFRKEQQAKADAEQAAAQAAQIAQIRAGAAGQPQAAPAGAAQ